jgi:ferredoxin-NADP reductase
VLAEIETVTHNVKTFRFKPPHGEHIPFSYLPGQFLTLHVAPRGIPTTRSYTIASTPTWRDRIEITVKREEHGLVSRWLHDELRIGDEVQIEAPNGTFCFTGKQSESIVLIGGGVGMTPMMSAVRYLTETSWPGQVYLVQPWSGAVGHLGAALLALAVPDIATRRAHICGPVDDGCCKGRAR